MINRIPKASQLHFFMMPDEMSKVLEFIEQAGGVIYSCRSDSAKPRGYDPGKDIGRVFFLPSDLGKDINMRKIDEGFYTIDATTSPVIELEFSFLRESELSRGRIYFRGGYMGRNGWVSYHDSLYELFKSVSTFMKKFFLTKEQSYAGYLSRGAQSYVSGGGNLAQF
jgi:hypothetical protein